MWLPQIHMSSTQALPSDQLAAIPLMLWPIATQWNLSHHSGDLAEGGCLWNSSRQSMGGGARGGGGGGSIIFDEAQSAGGGGGMEPFGGLSISQYCKAGTGLGRSAGEGTARRGADRGGSVRGGTGTGGGRSGLRGTAGGGTDGGGSARGGPARGGERNRDGDGVANALSPATKLSKAFRCDSRLSRRLSMKLSKAVP